MTTADILIAAMVLFIFFELIGIVVLVLWSYNRNKVLKEFESKLNAILNLEKNEEVNKPVSTAESDQTPDKEREEKPAQEAR